MRISQKVRIDRPPADVFKLIGDQTRHQSFLAGATTFKPVTEQTQGVGARFRVLMKVGSVEIGGIVEISRWEDEAIIEWTSVQGVRQTGRWLLQPVDGGTELTFQLDYDIGGGPVGWLVERIAARTLAMNLWASLLAARRIVEAQE